MVVEDCSPEMEVATSAGAMKLLVKIVRPMLLGVSSERGHLNAHANGCVRFRRRALGRDCVNEQFRGESTLSGFVEETVGVRDLVPSVHFGE